MLNLAQRVSRPFRWLSARPGVEALAAREATRACQKSSIATTKLGANITAIPSQKPCTPDNISNSHRRSQTLTDAWRLPADPVTLSDVICLCTDQRAQLLASRCRGAKTSRPGYAVEQLRRLTGAIHLTDCAIHCAVACAVGGINR